jgi:hypothetical protein
MLSLLACFESEHADKGCELQRGFMGEKHIYPQPTTLALLALVGGNLGWSGRPMSGQAPRPSGVWRWPSLSSS